MLDQPNNLSPVKIGLLSKKIYYIAWFQITSDSKDHKR